jgi:hypothetical protein
VVFIGLLIAVVIVLAFSMGVLESGFAAANKSTYTQAHGVSRAATVISVTSNGSKSGNENVAASLADPADGQQSTTVHVPSTQSFSAGATVQILIDPQDPGYAELPGQRFMTASTAWGTAAAFWLIAAILMLLMIPAALGWGRQRRRRASPSAATGTSLPAGMRGISARDRHQPGAPGQDLRPHAWGGKLDVLHASFPAPRTLGTQELGLVSQGKRTPVRSA